MSIEIEKGIVIKKITIPSYERKEIVSSLSLKEEKEALLKRIEKIDIDLVDVEAREKELFDAKELKVE